MEMLPAKPGTYALALRLGETQSIRVRGVDRVFAPGVYIYVGSAAGPGGIRARLGRHIRGDGKPRWHVDLFRVVTNVMDWNFIQDVSLECHWAQTLANLPGAFIPMPGFGASDCRQGCPAHLVGFPAEVKLNLIWDKLGEINAPQQMSRG